MITDGEEDLKVLAHERLGDVLCTLKSVLQCYPPLNTTELFTAAGALIAKIKSKIENINISFILMLRLVKYIHNYTFSNILLI